MFLRWIIPIAFGITLLTIDLFTLYLMFQAVPEQEITIFSIPYFIFFFLGIFFIKLGTSSYIVHSFENNTICMKNFIRTKKVYAENIQFVVFFSHHIFPNTHYLLFKEIEYGKYYYANPTDESISLWIKNNFSKKKYSFAIYPTFYN